MTKHTSRVAVTSFTVALSVLICLILSGCSATPAPRANPQEMADPLHARTLLDAGWSFHRGDLTPAEQVAAAEYDDHAWQRVDVPHDYILDGQYANSPVKEVRGHGYLPYDVGWYRRHLTIDKSANGKILRLDFDGVFRDSKVYFNGQLLGEHKSGYTPFSYDITALAKIGGDNVIAVRVDPREFEGWWYEGGGIYRHVRLTELSPLHVRQFGTYIVSTVPNGNQGAAATANISVQTTLENAGPDATPDCQLVCEILDPAGKSMKSLESILTAPANANVDVTQQTTIDHPQLWSPDSPALYQLRTTVMLHNKLVDRTTTAFGIRTLRFDKDHGLFVNGKHVMIYGLANHQDFDGLGIAVPDSLQPWRVQTLKHIGANAWRTAHNAPSESLIDACDRLGMMVMDENRHLGDNYTHHQAAGLTGDHLDDLATMIQRDRNHPSIIMWSMSNEEGQQHTPEGAAVFRKMMDVVHRYDKTRPITSAVNSNVNHRRPDVDEEEIFGLNYHDKDYDGIRKAYPDKFIFGSEDTNNKTARGEYKADTTRGMASSYNLSEKGWQAIIQRPYFAGSFTWTGFDYRGEPNPSGWPDVSNNTGLFDLCGFPKDKAYYFESCWSDKPMVHILPSSWNFDDGEPIRVLTWSNARQVELFLNDKSLGKHDVPKAGHAEWQVPYAAGTLRAVASTDGKQVAVDQIQTAGKPASLKITTDRLRLSANAQDAVVVAVTLYDSKGVVVPNADQRIIFKLSGNARILGVGNGNPANHDPCKADNVETFHGKCMCVVEAGAAPTSIQITASSPGVPADTLILKSN